MAFDHENHTIDPNTGFQIHKDTGHRIGIDSAPHAPVSDDPDWPKWVIPHPGHIVHQGDHIVTPMFPDFHVRRGDQQVMVLVGNPDDEARALADPAASKDVEPGTFPAAGIPNRPPPPPGVSEDEWATFWAAHAGHDPKAA